MNDYEKKGVALASESTPASVVEDVQQTLPLEDVVTNVKKKSKPMKKKMTVEEAEKIVYGVYDETISEETMKEAERIMNEALTSKKKKTVDKKE